MASISERKGTYRIKVSLGYDNNGRQIIKSTTYKPPQNTTPKKAEKLANDFAVEFEKKCKGAPSLDDNMRFYELANWFLENYAQNELKPTTVYNYRLQIEKNLLPELGNKKLKYFNSAMLTEFFKNRNYKPATCKKIFVILQSIFHRAVEQRFIENSPCEYVILPKVTKSIEKKPFLDEFQARELLKTVEEYSQFNTVIKMLLYTGARSGEVLALRWTDIDFENKLIHIENTLADVGGHHWLQPPKTPESNRFIGLSDTLAEILQEHKREQSKIINELGELYKYPEMVFTSSTGNFVDRGRLNLRFKKFVKNTDYDFLTLHSLRHCNATLLINAGIDLKIVSELLGHSDVRTTANTYADVLQSSKAKCANLVALKLQ